MPFIVIFLVVLIAWAAGARDLDGRWAQSPHRDWIKGLTDKNGVNCCDEADGEEVEGWAFGPDGYKVKIKGEWFDVPNSAVIEQPNRLGFARVWIMHENGKPKVRCFLPGAGG